MTAPRRRLTMRRLVGGLLLAAVVAIHGWIKGPPGVSVMDLFTSALYTAFLAPIVLGLLHLTRKAFAFTRRRRAGAF